MFAQLRLTTKLGLLVTTGVVGALAIGLVGLVERTDRWHRASELPGRVATVRSLARLQDVVGDEAALSAWFVAAGEPKARSLLAEARPRTDQAARALGRVHGPTRASLAPAVAQVEQDWNSLRIWRSALDRRVISDTATLARFDRLTQSVGRALDESIADDDTAMAGTLRARAAISELDAAIAHEQSVLLMVTARAATTRSLVDRLRASAAEQTQLRDPAFAWARREIGPAADTDIAAARSSGDRVHTLRAPALRGSVPYLTVEQWRLRSGQQRQAVAGLAQSLDTTAAVRTTALQQAARAAVLRWIALLAAVSAGVVIAGLVLLRAIRRPLRAVTGAATVLADREREAAEYARARREVPPAAPVAVETRDELGDIARAIHGLDCTIVESLTAQQQSMHNDISDLLVNIARRNEPLLSRQLALIDGLQTSEAGPDQMASLVQLDHLAARMRRNSEGLLALAGVDQPRVRTDPVPLHDMVLSAVAEVEGFQRVDVAGIPRDTAVIGRIAVDLAHILAELIENATAHTATETRVVIGARRRPTEIQLTISDQGTGLPVDQLDALNEQLMHPLLPGFDLSGAVGLAVVARIGERIGVRVALRSAPGAGTAAIVSIPVALIATGDEDAGALTSDASWAPPEVHPAPVPFEEAPDLLLASTGIPSRPLPRRQPASCDTAPVSEPRPPAPRTPAAMFELIARYEAGRRRADRTVTTDA